MSDEKKLPERIRHVPPAVFDKDYRVQGGKVYNVLRRHEKGLVCEPGTGVEEILSLEECMDEHGHGFINFSEE